MMMKKLSLIKDVNRQSYYENYINEIRSSLIDFGLDKNDIEVLMNKFKIMVKKDSSYVFHYDSQYWANYILEASGLNKRLVTI